MVEIRPPITLEDLEVAGSMPDPVKLDTCNCDHCVSQAKLEQVVRYEFCYTHLNVFLEK